MKAGWGQKTHDFPSLGEICRLTTSKEVVEYMLEKEILPDKTGNVCGKIHTYQYSSKTKPPCTGTLNVEGPHLNNMYWRCNKQGCRERTPIFADTLLDQLNIPLPDIVTTVYLSLLHIPVSDRMFYLCTFLTTLLTFCCFLVILIVSKNTLLPWYGITSQR